MQLKATTGGLIIIWGSVLALTLYPLHIRFTQLLKGRKWISASVITLIMFLLIIVPATMLTLATVDEFKTIKELYNEGLLSIVTVRNVARGIIAVAFIQRNV